MNKGKSSSEITEMVFHFLGSGIRFTSERSKIQRVFYGLYGNSQFSSLLEGFTFNISGNYPVSSAVENTINSLLSSGLLVAANANEFEVSKELADKKFEKKRKFTKKERQELEKLAQEFRRKMTVICCQ